MGHLIYLLCPIIPRFAFVGSVARHVNIIMISQGSSEVNISFVVDSADGTKVIRALHKEFIE